MAKWRECKMGDLLEIRHGFAFLGEHFGSSGTHVVLTPGNFLEEGGFKEKADKAKWYSGPIPDDYVLNEGDLIVAMTEQAEGLLGSSALIPRSGVYLHNQRLGLVQIRDRKLADQRFIYYLFNSKPVRQQIRGSASGTKIRHTAPSRIADVKVSVPPLPVQRRIAGILSAYDELMENSQRRIRHLEAMARALYREWFVHFRYPGHEKHPRVASPLGDIPQSWEVCALGDFVQFKSGFAFKSGTFTTDGEHRLVTIKNVQDGAFNPESDSRMSELPPNLPPYCVLKDGDILLSLTGNVGRVCLVYDGPFLLNQRVSKLAPVEAFDWAMTYCMFREPAMRVKLEQLSNGVAQQNLSPVLASKMEFARPPRELRQRFAVVAEPMVRRIVQLYSTIQNLRRTRDLLLPRLLSGQVELADRPR
jgi:type I restriction enzyme S subunit